jgi:hypothetical protein
LPTYNDPEEFARLACQFHEENDGPAMTHRDALLRVGMTDPLQINKAVAIMRNLTAENAEFHHLTVEKKYVETSRAAAEAREVPKGRSVIKMETRQLKAVDDAKKAVGRMDLPEPVKEVIYGFGEAITDGAGRTQNTERTSDMIEVERELAAVVDKAIRKVNDRAERAEAKAEAEKMRADMEKARAERAEAEIQRQEATIQFFRSLIAAQMPNQPGEPTCDQPAPGKNVALS